MQAKMQEMQAKLEAHGDRRRRRRRPGAVTLNGKGELRRREDRPEGGRSGDIEMLQDLIVAAHADAQAQRSRRRAAAEMQKVTGGLATCRPG